MGEIFSRAEAAKPLPWTGERLAQGAGMQVELEHLHRYFLAREFARGLDVLDLASGEGYGSAFLSQTARSVVGVDIDAASVAHAEAAYPAANLRFAVGDARCLPLPDAAFDLVVSFETLEHLHEHDAFLTEIRRVLRPGGRLLLSTPDRDTYSPADSPANPFHLRELSRAEFGTLLRRHFGHVAMLGQRPMLGSAIIAEAPGAALTFEQRGPDRFEASEGLPRAVYLLAMASDAALPALPQSLYIQTGRVQEAVQQAAVAPAAPEQDLRGLRASLALLRKDLQDTGAARGQAETDRTAALHSLAESEAALRVSVETLRALEAELRAARAALAEAQAYGRHVEANYQASASALASGAAYARRVEAELTVQRTRAEQSEPVLQAILASQSWRITAPLRQVAAGYPAIRRSLRAVATRMPWMRRAPVPAIPVAEHVPAVALVPAIDPKADLSQALREALQQFLDQGQRLDFTAGPAPDVSVLIVLYDQAHLTLRCLQALHTQRGVALEVVLVDNASSDATGALLDRLDGVRVIRNDTNRGFLHGANQAAAVARGRHLLLLNNDAFLRPGTLAAAMATLDTEPDAGAVGARLILPSGVLQEAGCIVWSDAGTQGYARGLPPDAAVAMFRRDVDYCSGAFLLTPRAVWETLGGFDEGYAPAYYEEVDYCMRLREAGLRVIYEPAAVVDHYEFGSEVRQGDAMQAMERNAHRFRERHAVALLRDHLSQGPHNLLAARHAVAGRRRRLLMIDDLLPLEMHGSGLPRARAMVASAVAAGWTVTHYPLHERTVDWDRVRRELPATVEVANKGGVAGLRAFLAERAGQFDTILVSRPHNMAYFRKALDDQPAVLGTARLLYDAEAIYAVRDIAQAALEGHPVPAAEAERRIAEEIQRCAGGTQGVICVTQDEWTLFHRHLPPDQQVYRLAHAPAAGFSDQGHAARRGFLFVGRLLEQDSPNWRGLTWFLRECWPLLRQTLPDATLTVVGQLHPDHAALAAPGVTLAGAVEDLRPCYAAARVFLAPVRFAAGVPLKIVEATAAGLPVACTTLMAQQMGWEDGDALAAADDPAALVAKAVTLHEDATSWQAMRDRAQALLRRDFGTARFQETLAAALDGKPAPTATCVQDHRLARVEAVWGKAPPRDAGALWAAYPFSHPVIRREMNRRATGDAEMDDIDGLRALLQRKGQRLPLARAASLCCGTGALERQLVTKGLVTHCIGYDLAAGALEVARAEARTAGLGGAIEYRQRDLDRQDLGEIGLDLVIGCQSIHHIERLEFAFQSVHAALRPGGFFHLGTEFVGPDRFQWTDRQIEEMNGWLGSLPERYRVTRDGQIKLTTGRAGVAEMLAHDPTEAARSSMIEPLLAERFDILERRALGGTLTMMALAEIAHHFDPDMPEDVAHLRRLLDREAALMAQGAIGSDFVTITARRRD